MEEQGPAEGRRSSPTQWERVQVIDPHTVVVYWYGAAYGPLDRIETDYSEDYVIVRVFEQGVGKLAGRSKSAIVRLSEPLAGRTVRRGVPDS